MFWRQMTWVFALLGCITVSAQTDERATATIIDATGAKVGTATLTPTVRGTGVLINITLSGLPAGTHALHIHSVGKCDKPDFTSAGGHFNPEMKEHGSENPKGAHAGDLPNIELLGRGDDHVSMAVGGVTLTPGPNSLFHEGGTALVIHAKPDDYKTDPAGNAGPRIACGVIEKAER